MPPPAAVPPPAAAPVRTPEFLANQAAAPGASRPKKVPGHIARMEAARAKAQGKQVGAEGRQTGEVQGGYNSQPQVESGRDDMLAKHAAELDAVRRKGEAERQRRDDMLAKHADELDALRLELEAARKRRDEMLAKHAAELHALRRELEVAHQRRDEMVAKHAAELDAVRREGEAERKRKDDMLAEKAAELDALRREGEAARKRVTELTEQLAQAQGGPQRDEFDALRREGEAARQRVTELTEQLARAQAGPVRDDASSTHDDGSFFTHGQTVQSRAEAAWSLQLTEELQARLQRLAAVGAETSSDLTAKLTKAKEEGDKYRASESRMAAELEEARQDVRRRTAEATQAQAEAANNQRLADELQSRLSRLAANGGEANGEIDGGLAARLEHAKEQGDIEAQARMAVELESLREAVRARTAEAAHAHAAAVRSQQIAEEMKSRLDRASERLHTLN